MADNHMENKPVFGQIQIADEVIAIIASTAAKEVEGVTEPVSDAASSFVEFFGKKNQAKGVKVTMEEGEASIEIFITILFGTKIKEAALEVQKRVKNAVETMAGLTVTNVNVNVSGIIVEKNNTAEKMLEEE